MVFHTCSVLTAISLLLASAVARPRADLSDPGVIEQKAHITAFIVDDSGQPSVECWEISTDLPGNAQRTSRRRAGSKEPVRMMSMEVGAGAMIGVDIMTWPFGPIWGQGVHSSGVDLSSSPGFFTVESGLFSIQGSFGMTGSSQSSSGDEVEDHIFSLENGDDWFYFEDKYTDSHSDKMDKASSPALGMSSQSATGTTLIRFKYERTPTHKVLHKGACSFSGLEPVDDSKVDKDVAAFRLTVQEL